MGTPHPLHFASAPRGVHQRGFILPLTLWIVALMGLGIAAINTWVSAAVENSRILQRRAESDLEITNLKSELVYLMATRPMTYRGLEVGENLTRPDRFDFMAVMAATYQSSEAIVFDGRPYIVESNPDFVIQLQDSRGLINLNTITGPYLRRFLSEFNVPETFRDRLIDTLQDWIDDDDSTRQSGAEAPDYERLGRVPPSNAALLSPLEAQSILDWDTVPQLWEADRRSPLFTTCAAAGFNPNTAPESILMSYIIGLTRENQAEVVKRRNKTPFRNQYEFGDASGVITPNEAFFFAFTPSLCAIVDVTDRTSNERFRFSLSLIPNSRYQPWQVDYEYRIPSQYREALDQADPTVTFPSPETVSLRDSGSNPTSGSK